MITVGLLTSWGTRCGISEYSKYLTEYAQAEDVVITVEDQSIASFASNRRGITYDIIHVVASGHVMGGYEPHQLDILRQQTRSGKFVLTWHDCNPVDNRNDFSNRFDRVIIFEPKTVDGFDYIPQACPVYEVVKDSPMYMNYIGTSGFPQGRKNLLALAEAVQILHCTLYAFIPESPHADAQWVANEIRRRNPSAIIRTDWVTNDEVLSHLSKCMAVCYPYINWINGSSAAALFGASARVPIFVSRASQFDSLGKEYTEEDGVYFIESTHPTIEDIVSTFKDKFRQRQLYLPHKVYEDHRWDKVGLQYTKLYRDIMK